MVTTKSKGQGLGLAVVKRLVEALNALLLLRAKLVKNKIHNRVTTQLATAFACIAYKRLFVSC